MRRVVLFGDQGGLRGQRSLPFVGDYRIEISADGRSWREVASGADRRPATSGHRERRLFQLEVTPAEQVHLGALQREIADRDREIAAVEPLPDWWVGQFRPSVGPYHVFLGGDPQRKGAEVVPASLSLLAGATRGFRLEENSPESERRLALARWITAADNPLTPRVLANRVWHYHFGRGIVDTPSDFGAMGGKPTHPELLDWLARFLIGAADASGRPIAPGAGAWTLKRLHRLILTSQTYQQSAAYRAAAARVDGDSRLLWRFPPRRLSAEELRDTFLAVSGKLDRNMGGPGFRLYEYQEDNVATYVPLAKHGPETYRRAVYHQSARAARVDLLTDFDCPDPAFAAPRRVSTTTPLQALTLMNHTFTMDMGRFLAERLEREAPGDPGAQVRRAFLLGSARAPTPEELSVSVRVAREHGLPALCRALLNSNEWIYLN
ncbi:MAG: DUF1553 domain-containing protein [Armatimonadetes bacterium]|nr:DUF1553 domain-containing protein [Armatimonadota bacterium]